MFDFWPVIHVLKTGHFEETFGMKGTIDGHYGPHDPFHREDISRNTLHSIPEGLIPTP